MELSRNLLVRDFIGAGQGYRFALEGELVTIDLTAFEDGHVPKDTEAFSLPEAERSGRPTRTSDDKVGSDPASVDDTLQNAAPRDKVTGMNVFLSWDGVESKV